MFTIIVFIIILGVLVFVHELGHFVVAKRSGIKAEEFGFGFPPRICGVFKDDKTGKYRLVKGSKEVVSKNTLYSLNWFPIGGFVRIKGEDGEGKKETDSFASKSAWTRIKVLIAGVTMNFIFAWLLLSATFMMGAYQDVTGQHISGSKILIEGIETNSPAEKMGLRAGDVLLNGGSGTVFSSVEDVQKYIGDNKGKEIELSIQRGRETLELKGVPREQTQNGQGALGISSLGEVVTVHYSLFGALWNGLIEIGNVMLMMLDVFRRLFAGNQTGLTVTGIVGIAAYTGQVIPLGLAFILRFAAILSINLGVINAFPFPALDGGRILFILIEKVKGSPVSQKVEQLFHTVGFLLLILLMVVVTYFDLMRFDIVDKIKGLF